MIKVSVVIPIYNVELYLKEALDSIINQSLKEIEIILINDGSTDNSLNIIREYEEKDKRVIVINQKNQGQSVARNEGIQVAQGKYIYFMDSDDYVDLDTLELCYQKAEKEKVDFLFFDAISFSKDLKVNKNKFIYDRNGLVEKIQTGKEYLKKLIQIKKYKCSPCLHFININYLKNNNLCFYPGIIHEDELFAYKLYLNAERVNYINRKFFKRRLRENSTMTTLKSEKNIIGYLTVARELKKVLEFEKGVEKIKLINIRIVDIVNNATGILNFLDKNLQNKYKIEIKNEFKNYLTLKSKIKLDYPNIFKIIKKIKEKVV